ncbi:hypothetical protein N801_18920 [Knoellia aerolata DSM 18566]|uniref:Uncharacterized protein n=1 Tax=Knoellia aerolata DSM 18566 TaxID=1385519 RepID=A0A0A0JW00_9MICO|nr:hypothetical protein N801_18920 [Knoellia aerolata DSM 18566]
MTLAVVTSWLHVEASASGGLRSALGQQGTSTDESFPKQRSETRRGSKGPYYRIERQDGWWGRQSSCGQLADYLTTEH